jgi:hypothetical protein
MIRQSEVTETDAHLGLPGFKCKGIVRYKLSYVETGKFCLVSGAHEH